MRNSRAPAERNFHLIESLSGIPETARSGVVAIGNFDGVHRGHQAVLDTALEIGRTEGLPVLAMTFEPHPRTVFRPEAPVFRLTPPAVKARIIRAIGFDGLVIVPFDHVFAAIPAETFIEEALLGTLSMRHVVTGYDFHFGKARQGSPSFLAARGAELGFGVTVVEAFADEGGEPVSSSRIRAALEVGDITAANALLGYRWFVSGTVVHGDRRGRELGYPTANIPLAANCRLHHGIYAVTLRFEGEVHEGVASYGRRPTFDNGPPLLEVHLFDFSRDLYGGTVEVAFFGYIRSERKFDSIEALVSRMDRDCEEARAMLASARPLSPLDLGLGMMSDAVPERR